MRFWKAKCRQCGKPFRRTEKRSGCQQIYCSSDCRVRRDRNQTKLKYRNDESFREAMKMQNLNRYHERKRQAEGSGAAQ